MISNPLIALRNLVTQDSRTVGVLDQTLSRALGPFANMFDAPEQAPAPQQLGTFDPATAGGMVTPAGAQGAAMPAPPPRDAGAQPSAATNDDLDNLYQSVGSALGVTTPAAGPLTTRERAGVEADLGAILNEVYDPDSAVDADRRHGVADLFTGLGIGFGQMSRGDRVDLSEVRQAAERRQQQNVQLRMERSRRAAGASYAMELGDEGLARAIAAGAADVNTLLTKRQQDIVNRRADEATVREAANAGYLADALDGVLPAPMVEAIRNGADPTTMLRANDLSRAATAAAQTQERIDNQIAFAQTMIERATETPDQLDPITTRALELATLDNFGKISAGGSMFDYMSEARLQTATGSESGFTLGSGQTRFDAQGNPIAAVGAAPAGDSGQVLLAQQVLANPTATPDQIAAANVVVETGGATTLPQAIQALTAGAPSADTTTRTQRIATLTEGFAAQNVPPEQADALARGIVDGRYETVQDPQTGEVTVYDKVAMMTSQDRAAAQVFPPPPGPSDYDPPSILNSALDYTAAFGPEGVVLNALNNLGEAIGLGVLDENNREAVQTVRRLATNGRIASAIEVAGRPSNYLLEMFQDLETNPAQLFTGPGTALIRLENQRAATVRELQQLDELLAPGSGVSAAMRSDAQARKIALRPILSDLDVVISGLNRSSSNTSAPADARAVEPIPDSVRNNATLTTAAENAGITVDEIWKYLSPGARERLLGEAR